jgi:hypothetical protein
MFRLTPTRFLAVVQKTRPITTQHAIPGKSTTNQVLPTIPKLHEDIAGKEDLLFHPSLDFCTSLFDTLLMPRNNLSHNLPSPPTLDSTTGEDFINPPTEKGLKPAAQHSSLFSLPTNPLPASTLSAKRYKELKARHGAKMWPFALPVVLQPRAGTAFWERYVDADIDININCKEEVGWLQELLYGIPETAIDININPNKDEAKSMGWVQKLLYGVPEAELAKMQGQKKEKMEVEVEEVDKAVEMKDEVRNIVDKVRELHRVM